MKRVCQIAVVLLIVAVIGGGLFAYINWKRRYRWPSKPVPWVQDLPPLVKSHWPKEPATWKTVRAEVEIATPSGNRLTNLTYQVNSLGMRFVLIEPGTFWLGLTERQALRMYAERKIGRQVTLTKPYFLAAYEVTNELYDQFDPGFVKRRPEYQLGKDRRGRDFDQHPVEGVTWQEAQQFCRWLSEKEGRLYRLPTEAEWEYACKAGTTTLLYWGDTPWDRLKANVGGIRSLPETYAEDGHAFTAHVGVYPANPWGLFDMVGNEWEWVNDWFDWIPSEPATDPVGPPSGHIRVKKGAAWDTRTRDIKSCARDGNNPADLYEKNGFRVLCEAE